MVCLSVFTSVYGQTNNEKNVFELVNKIRQDSTVTELEWNDDYYETISTLIYGLEKPKSSTTVDVNDYLSKIYYKIDNSTVTSYYGYFENIKGGKYEDLYILKNLQSYTKEPVFIKDSDEITVKNWMLKIDGKEILFYYILLIDQLDY